MDETKNSLAPHSIFLFCKSYKNDVLRANRLIESVARFNRDRIPFFISVPRSDFVLFREMIDSLDHSVSHCVQLVEDEQIVAAHPTATLDEYYALPGYQSQQVVKSEAWRLIQTENFVCLDSDAYFIRDFYRSNFFAPNGNLYSLLHDASDLLQDAQSQGKLQVIDNFIKDCRLMKEEFGREGPDFDFGPPPMLWSRSVWQSLEEEHLSFKGENLYQAIGRLPHEIRWYGEALLKFKAIPIEPIGPLFKFYHYRWQVKGDPVAQALDEGKLGVVIQSNWDKDTDPLFARKSRLSRWWRKIRGR